MPRLFALLLLLSAVACRTPPLDYDGGVPGAGADLAGPSGSHDLAAHATPDLHATPTSCCGVAGNPGNELGVGKFCQGPMDCMMPPTAGLMCATMISPNLTFCTMPCTTNGSNTECGSGAQCRCAASGQCACIPGECLMPPPGC
ncbi:MAG TPA: hypothetical protein VF945_19390 [Polyangia bacterium]